MALTPRGLDSIKEYLPRGLCLQKPKLGEMAYALRDERKGGY